MENRVTKDFLSFMSWNVYLGADFTSILTTTPTKLPQVVTDVFRQFLATSLPARVKEIARQILFKTPDIIGLQEVVQWQLVAPHSQPVTYDFIELLLNELKKRGLNYEVAAVNSNFSIELPTSHGNLVRFMDRDAILVRKRLSFTIMQRKETNFRNNLVLKIGGQPVEVIRGWSFIDIKVNERTLRVINTHLEPVSSLIQVAQGNELLKGPAQTLLPVIILGDFNSKADGSGTLTYRNFIHAGFHDVWAEVGNGPGYTCCQDPDLLNATSSLNKRIDYIFYKNGWKPNVSILVGEEQDDRTPTALWPSDHAGVYAILFFKEMPNDEG
ncbi:endonuclease/exonuclease/phosphatase family protein [Bacillus sp. Marseille-P3661]|uniref:endonuclease/exonuclease/phosphatase family protein n=1 Tax=Bacillus sp. Marseille-P3661 TaxID=1936234 RepID=UPI0021555321|nr:endonuclease/exonuclease/phosphatase family protein [Bacillus sp. Marseille-P3661]